MNFACSTVLLLYHNPTFLTRVAFCCMNQFHYAAPNFTVTHRDHFCYQTPATSVSSVSICGNKNHSLFASHVTCDFLRSHSVHRDSSQRSHMTSLNDVISRPLFHGFLYPSRISRHRYHYRTFISIYESLTNLLFFIISIFGE